MKRLLSCYVAVIIWISDPLFPVTAPRPAASGAFPKSAPARFGCKQRRAHNDTGVGYGGAVSTRSGGTPVRTARAELACLSLGVEWLKALLQRNAGSRDPTSDPRNIQKYELASERPGGLSSVVR